MENSYEDLLSKFHFKSTTDTTELEKFIKRTILHSGKTGYLCVTSEASVYKVVNKIKEMKCTCEIEFINGMQIESRLDANNLKYNIIEFEKMFGDNKDGISNGTLSCLDGKIVVVPKLTKSWTPETVAYFVNRMNESGAYLFIFYTEIITNKLPIYSNGFSNTFFLNCAVGENTMQFPEELYKARDIQDDNF